MKRIKPIILNLVFCIQVLLTFLLLFGDNINLPIWLQVAGRLHPLILHLPIGLWILFFVMQFLRKHDGLEHKTYDTISFSVLLFAALTASVTAFFGFLLSVHGEYGPTLATHKISGVALSWLCYFVLITYDWQKDKKAVFYAVNSFTLFTLIFAGHTGASLTHGENFVFEPMMKNAAKELSLEHSTVYELSVRRVFEKKCFSCHNDSKAKGGLVMGTPEQFTAGGKHGAIVKAGNPDESNLVKAIELPLTDDHHMPPDGKAQLTGEEINLIRTWIAAGANFEHKIADLKPDDSLRTMTLAMMASEVDKTNERTYPFAAASADVVAKLNSPFLSLAPLYQNSPALRADFYVRESFKVEALENLKLVNEQLVELNLARMPVTDKQLPLIAKFSNLEKLNLNFTDVTGDLTPLASLKHLRSLSLSGTAVTSRSLSGVASAPALKELFLWNTTISQADQLAFSKEHPEILVVWKTMDENQPVKLSMPSVANEDVLKRNEPLTLKHPMPGVVIRYTTDGSDPDSVNGETFSEPISLKGTTKLKAYAVKEGWLKSDVFEIICFTEGYKPVGAKLLSKPDPQYPGEGAQSLMDGRKGNADLFKEPSWLGYRENAFEAEFDFQKDAPTLNSIAISYGKNTGGYIFPPTEVEVWAGNSKEKVSLIKTLKVQQPTSNEPVKVEALVIPLEKSTFAYYRLVCKPVKKLPAWHSGKGDKGWFFVDEVFFN